MSVTALNVLCRLKCLFTDNYMVTWCHKFLKERVNYEAIASLSTTTVVSWSWWYVNRVEKFSCWGNFRITFDFFSKIYTIFWKRTYTK